MDPRLVCLGLGSVCGKRGGRSHGCKRSNAQIRRSKIDKHPLTQPLHTCAQTQQQVVGIAVLCIGAAIIDVRAVLSMFMPASASRKQKSAAGSTPPSPASVAGAPSYQGVTAAPAPKWGWFRFANWYACVWVFNHKALYTVIYHLSPSFSVVDRACSFTFLTTSVRLLSLHRAGDSLYGHKLLLLASFLTFVRDNTHYLYPPAPPHTTRAL